MTLVDSSPEAGSGTTWTEIDAWEEWLRTQRADLLAIEEPLEIRLAGWSVAVTMRTPGHDFDLAAGFLLTEGILPDRSAIASIAHCAPEDDSAPGNVVNVNPSDPELVRPEEWQRNFYMSSSCGVCGKASIASVRQQCAPVQHDGQMSVRALYAMDRTLRRSQAVFARTGGLHAAALFEPDGQLVVAREDVGRHNAVDKVIGHAMRDGITPLQEYVLLVTSRGSFEIVQKALMAGIAIVATVSAPSSLAVDLARSSGLTLVGFLRSDRSGVGRCNVYAGGHRIVLDDTEPRG